MFLYTQTVLYCIQYANLSFKKYQSIFIKVNEFSASLAFLAKYLHYSQTINQEKVYLEMFEYHTYLHHSQTSNPKMKCHHKHKYWYSNYEIKRFRNNPYQLYTDF